jgi:hypothetical protein
MRFSFTILLFESLKIDKTHLCFFYQNIRGEQFVGKKKSNTTFIGQRRL